MTAFVLACRALLTAAVTSAAVGVTWLATGDAARDLVHRLGHGSIGSDDQTVERLVAELASTCCLVAVAALATLVALGGTAILTAARLPRLAGACDRVTPPRLRRLIAACCGVGLVATLPVTLTAVADGAGHRQACHLTCRTSSRGLAGLGFPDLPTQERARLPDEPARRAGEVVVRAGDSLWLIAARRLPSTATTAEVNALTRRLYALNRSTIGDDPDLIFPGMTLLAPEGTS